MTITTEEAERLAHQHDLVRFTLGMKAPEHDLTAATIRSLAAERDALQADNVNLRDDLASAERERAHQHGRADRNATEYAREQAKRETLQARVAELEGALRSIAGNTCCDKCQEAALVARAVLEGKKDE